MFEVHEICCYAVFSSGVSHTPCLPLGLACHSTAHSWPASALQLPSDTAGFPAVVASPYVSAPRWTSRRRRTAVDVPTWLQYLHILAYVSPAEISCLTFVLFSLWFLDQHLHPACLPPSSLMPTPLRPAPLPHS